MEREGAGPPGGAGGPAGPGGGAARAGSRGGGAAGSQMLDRLVQQGFIQRSENPEDRRGKCLTLTEKGQAFLQKGIHVRQRWIRDLVDSLSLEEKQAANETIAMLVAKARALEGCAKNPHCEGEDPI